MEFLAILTILIFLSPIVLLYGLLNIKYEFIDDTLYVRILGVVSKKIPLSNIESYEKFNQLPFLKGRFEDLAFNKAVMIRLKNPQQFAKFYVVAPRDIDGFILNLEKALKR